MKKRIITIFAVLLLFCGIFTVSFAGEEGLPLPEAAAPVSTEYSAQELAGDYINVIENHVKTYLYANRMIDHSVVPVDVPILMFHHISDEPGSVLTSDFFRSYMAELKENGYQTIFYDDLYAFVKGEGELPDKPIIISFDDGYLSNYLYAYPILKGLGMKAEISIVGSTVGRDTHPETGNPIIPHFTWEQAKEMVDSGVIRIRSHSYNMHQHVSAEDVSRLGVIKNPFESDSLYSTMFSGDCQQMKELIQSKLGYEDIVFTYPYGKLNTLTETILKNLKYKISVTTDVGINKVRIGDFGSLRGMKRIPCDANDSNGILTRIAYYSK